MNKIPANVAPPAGPCCLVIFGASGDLTHRLLVPALYNLAAGGLLPGAFAIIGIGRREMSNGAFRSDLAQALRRFAIRGIDERITGRLLARATYVNGEADHPSTYERLDRELAQVERACATGGNRLIYLATPPSAFAPISGHLGRSSIAHEKDGAWRRLIVEKPFGTDLASAQALNRELLGLLEEHQIYRIDHYLGKETVQNILVLRFANGLFEPIWNRDHIDHVQITVAETLTVGRRGRFYDATGALRDMVPNHLFQLFSPLVAMEPPSRFEAHAVRSEKAEALDAVHVPSEADALRDSVRARMASVRSTQEEYVGRLKNSPITCAATRHVELAEFSVLFGPPTLQRPGGLRETSPQLRRFLIFGRGLYGDGEAIHHGHGGQQGRSQRRFGMLVAQHPVWDHGCGSNGGPRDLRAVFCANRFRSTRL